MQKIAVIALASLAIAGAACAQYKTASPAPAPVPAPAPAPVPVTLTPQPAAAPLESAKRIDRPEAIEMVKDGKAVWVDVRPKDQYEIGHIKGALNIPLGDLITRIKELPPHKYIITYCA